MKIKYFSDTDTLYIEFRENTVTETRDLDEDTLLDLDSKGDICALPSSTPPRVPEFRSFLTSKWASDDAVWPNRASRERPRSIYRRKHHLDSSRI